MTAGGRVLSGAAKKARLARAFVGGEPVHCTWQLSPRCESFCHFCEHRAESAGEELDTAACAAVSAELGEPLVPAGQLHGLRALPAERPGRDRGRDRRAPLPAAGDQRVARERGARPGRLGGRPRGGHGVRGGRPPRGPRRADRRPGVARAGGLRAGDPRPGAHAAHAAGERAHAAARGRSRAAREGARAGFPIGRDGDGGGGLPPAGAERRRLEPRVPAARAGATPPEPAQRAVPRSRRWARR